MKNNRLKCLLFALILTAGNAFALDVEPLPLEQRKAVVNLPGMCSTKPGTRWDSGIVTGNGVMGASILGQPYDEKVVFNQERLFRPLFDARPITPEISSALPKVRRMMKAGKNSQALLYWREVMAENGHPEIVLTPSYHPAYTMHITREDAGAVSDYLRTVDFMTGEATVRYKNKKGRWINRTFVSRADNVIVQLFESPDGSPVSMDLKLVDQWQGLQDHMARIATDYSEQWLTARCKYKKTERGYEGTTRIICEGGTVETPGDKVRCLKARRILLLTRITDLDDFSVSEIPAMQTELSGLSKDYETLLARHVKLHGAAMKRVALHIDQSDDRYLSSEELIQKQSESKEIIPALLQKMFNMGRYALLSSSGNYPPPLTGIWNGSHKPAWSGDWTLDTNINQQMSGANTCAMPEALKAYLNLIEEIAPSWEVNAENIYGCRGILSGARTAGRENYHTHFGKWPGHCWTAGAAWLIYPLYEYYLVSGNTAFLQEHVLPLMEKSVLFYEDFLTEFDENGKLMFVPSYSPEHLPQQTINAVQDIAAAKQMISNTIEAYENLGIKPERIKQLKAMLEKFPPYLVNDEGGFQEWTYPGYVEHYDHRHMSHSYPVWPAHELSWEKNPKMMKAMRVALEKRLPQDWSGHNFAIRALCAARTKYPQLFQLNLNRLMRYDFIQPNLVTRHNPGWCPNTDVLCGLPGLLSEALVYSNPGVIELLPAWLPELPSGSIEGILTRTQAKVNVLQWDLNKKQVSVSITSQKDQWVTLVVRQGIKTIKGKAELKPSIGENMARKIFLKKGQPVHLNIMLEKKMNDYPVNTPALTAEEGDRQFIEKFVEKRKKK
ncbi:glycoside hydrolase family 95 protein [Verrucomicrobia bacterium S94]|nr:glycoside hydrolase family 95 protein [Verrucomicrobia bacterium S94]